MRVSLGSKRPVPQPLPIPSTFSFPAEVWGSGNQNPLPYHLARPRFMFTAQVYLRSGARRRGGPWMPKWILMTHPRDPAPQVRIDLRPTSKWARVPGDLKNIGQSLRLFLTVLVENQKTGGRGRGC